MTMFVITIIGIVLVSLGAILFLADYQSKSRPGSTKTLKFKMVTGDIYINLIEDDEGNRTMTYTTNIYNPSKENVYSLIENQRTGIYNEMLKWLSYDTDKYPDVTSVHGVSYE